MIKRKLFFYPKGFIYYKLFVITFLLVFSITSLEAVSKETEVVPNDDTKTITKNENKVYGPYCGVYCLFSLLKLYNKECKLSDLLKPEYISTSKGSSLKDLKKAAEDYNLQAVSIDKLTDKELIKSPWPIILHVKSSPDKKEYDHFEIFLSTENGKAKIFNPPEPVKLVPFYELSRKWSGTGLVVSDKPIEANILLAPARRRMIILLVFFLSIIFMLHWVKQRWFNTLRNNSWKKTIGFSVLQSCGLLSLSVMVGMMYHFMNDAGFLAHANSTTAIEEANIGSFIPKVDVKDVKKDINTKTVFIDARLKKDYDNGHLEGAISIPVNSTDEYRHKTIEGISKDSEIVVYCQSAGCKFAEKISKKLMSDGYTNISIFKGGWNDWKANK